MTDADDPPLVGVRVLDLAGPLGAYCGRLLADLGADVVRVEPPDGDPLRRCPPFAGDRPHPERSLPFLNFHANKRGIVLDLDQPDGRDTFLALTRVADVVVESFPPGTMARLGLGYDRLRATNPGLVLVSITPFGQTGPYRHFKANDLIGVATGGMMSINGEPHRPPCTSPLAQAYQMASLHAAFGALLALRERAASGRGQHVDVSMQDVQAHMFFNVVNYAATATIAVRQGERSTIVPNSIYPTRDGHVSLSVFQARHWKLLAEWLADPALADPGWEEREVRRESGDFIDERIGAFTRGFTTEQFVREAQRRHIPAGPVHTTAGFLHSPQVAARGMLVELEHPVVGRYRFPGPALRMGAGPPRVRRSAPTLGQHTAEVPDTWRSTSPRPRRPAPGSATRSLPLAGVRVLDFTRVWAGPFGTRLLADYGADVIRVESARFPDTRGAPHLPPAVRLERDAHFAEMHRNKRSITLDLHLPEGRALARRLVGIADLVVENFGPGVMERWELDYHSLRRVREDVIVVRMPGMGFGGPHSDWVAYGQQVMAYTGLSPLWRDPCSPLAAATKLAYPDFVVAATLAVAAVAALLHRERTGVGQCVEAAQIDAVASLMGVALLDYLLNGRVWEARGNDNPDEAPHAAYRCLGHDRWVAIACATEEEWHALCRAMGRPGLADDPRFATRDLRHAHRDALDPLIEAWTATQTPHQVMYRLQRAGVPAGVVASGEDLYHDPHLRERRFLETITHPDAGTLVHPGMTVRLSATPGRVLRPAPALGADNGPVLRDLLGLPTAAYDDLVARGVIA
jgi:crotonobetainyl-CoA:carnitine CoA-transferase CaiB-like acyl-CoA transferase